MKRNYKNPWWAAVFFLSLLLLFFIGQKQIRELSIYYKSVGLRLEEPIAAKEIFGTEEESEAACAAAFIKQKLGISEEEVFLLTAWTQERKASVSEAELGRTVKAAFIRVRGSMEDVLPVPLLSGAFCPQEDKRGCVLDAASAYELFKTKNAVGNTVYVDGEEYVVRGIVKEKLPVVMVQDTDSQTAFENLELRCENPQRQFIPEEGISVIETPFYIEMLEHVIQLPLWLAIFWCLWRLWKMVGQLGREVWQLRKGPEGRTLWQKKAKKLLFLAGLGCTGIFGIVFLVRADFLRFPLILPERYIPSRWSDFDFWLRRWKELRQLHQEISYLSPRPKDVIFREWFWQLFLEWVLGIGAFSGFIGKAADSRRK